MPTLSSGERQLNMFYSDSGQRAKFDVEINWFGMSFRQVQVVEEDSSGEVDIRFERFQGFRLRTSSYQIFSKLNPAVPHCTSPVLAIRITFVSHSIDLHTSYLSAA
jgi:hypothetical protein